MLIAHCLHHTNIHLLNDFVQLFATLMHISIAGRKNAPENASIFVISHVIPYSIGSATESNSNAY